MTTIASQTATAVFPLPPPSVASIDQGLNRHLIDLASNLQRLQANGSGGGVGGTASAADLASLGAVLTDLSEAIAGLEATLQQMAQTEAQGQFDADLNSDAAALLQQGQNVLERATASGGKLAAVGADMIIRAFVEGLRSRSAIVNEAVVRNNLALTVEAVNASLGLSSATVQQISQAYANGDEAEAISLNTVATQIAGNSASIVTIMGSEGGTASHWAVQTNLQGHVTGIVRLDGDVTGSTFTVVVDNFQVAKPGVSGGAAVPVFVIGTRNGTPAIGIRGDVFLDGSITANSLSVSQLSAINSDLGLVRAGRLLSQNDRTDFELNTGRLRIVATP